MKKGKDHPADSSKPVRSARTIQLAMAAVSLGMCLGITPGIVLKAEAQPAVSNEDATSGPQQPGGRFLKLEQPGAAFPKVEQSGAAFPKVERPGGAFYKVEQPAASFPKVEQPGASYGKITKP
ncbi:MAG: hypothetical protein ACOC0K_01985 [bacterium]